jgi:hypothetical protein
VFGISVNFLATDFLLYLLCLLIYISLSIWLFDVTVCIAYFILAIFEHA